MKISQKISGLLALLVTTTAAADALQIQANASAVYLYWGGAATAPAYRVERREGSGEFKILARVIPETDLKKAQKFLSEAPDTLSQVLTLKDDFQQQAKTNPQLDNALVEVSVGYAQLRALAYLDRSVSRNKRYAYRVVALQAGGETVVGEVETETLAEKSLVTPAVTAELVNDNPLLAWTAVPLLRYQIERAEQATGPWHRASLLPLVSAKIKARLQHEDKSAPQDGRRYFYRVLASDVFGGSAQPSTVASVATVDRTPPEPPSVNPANSGPAVIDLNWLAGKEPDLAGYHIYRRELLKGSSANERAQTGPEQRLTSKPLVVSDIKFQDTAVIPGRVYQYELTAIDRAGNESRHSPPVLARPRDTQPPAAPRALAGRTLDNGKVELSWSANTEADLYAYQLYRAADDGDYLLIKELPVAVATKSPQYIDQLDEQSQISYRYAVTALDATENESAKSEAVRMRLPDRAGPDAPILAALQAVNGGVDLGWMPSPSADVAGYHIWRGSSAQSLKRITDKPLASSTRTYRVNGIQAGISELYAVSAVDRNGNEGARAEPRSAGTFKQSAVTAPVALVLDNPTKTGKLRWQPVTNAQSYVVYVSRERDQGYQMFGELVTTPAVAVTAPASGQEWYRVQAVTPEGTVSAWSEPVAAGRP